jgi:hypothetical protein
MFRAHLFQGIARSIRMIAREFVASLASPFGRGGGIAAGEGSRECVTGEVSLKKAQDAMGISPMASVLA